MRKANTHLPIYFYCVCPLIGTNQSQTELRQVERSRGEATMLHVTHGVMSSPEEPPAVCLIERRMPLCPSTTQMTFQD